VALVLVVLLVIVVLLVVFVIIIVVGVVACHFRVVLGATRYFCGSMLDICGRVFAVWFCFECNITGVLFACLYFFL
jgi:hypothetical protein